MSRARQVLRVQNFTCLALALALVGHLIFFGLPEFASSLILNESFNRSLVFGRLSYTFLPFALWNFYSVHDGHDTQIQGP